MFSDMNVQSAGSKIKSRKAYKTQLTNGGKKQLTKGGKKQKRNKKGGTFLADITVPAGLLLLNQFMKHRKSKKAAKSRSKK